MPAGQHNEDRLQVSDLPFLGGAIHRRDRSAIRSVSVGHQRGENSAAAMMAT